MTTTVIVVVAIVVGTVVDPVFNSSASFEFIWEEVTIPIDYRDDVEPDAPAGGSSQDGVSGGRRPRHLRLIE